MSSTAGRGLERADALKRPGFVGLALVALVLTAGLLLLNGRALKFSAAGAGTRTTAHDQQTSNSVNLIGHMPEQKEVVDNLVDRFAAAGLHLPPLTFRFPASQDECGGAHGFYRGDGDIVVCVPSTRTISHEMAHAWEAHNLTDAEREAYQRLLGTPTWNSREFEWHKRAAELAANTIAFAVLNEDPQPHQQIRAFLCTYENLTGIALPTPLDPPCLSADPKDQIANPWWGP